MSDNGVQYIVSMLIYTMVSHVSTSLQKMPSPVDYLAAAVGQYVLYRAALDFVRIATPLYLAVPIAAYEGILGETLGRQAIQTAGIRIVLFDPIMEEMIRWIP